MGRIVIVTPYHLMRRKLFFYSFVKVKRIKKCLDFSCMWARCLYFLRLSDWGYFLRSDMPCPNDKLYL